MTAAFERFTKLDEKFSQARVTPDHKNWSHVLKVYLILRFAERHLFPSWRPVQASWELLLVGNYEGRRGANGRAFRQGVAPDEVYERAVTDAEEWQASGAKTAFLQETA